MAADVLGATDMAATCPVTVSDIRFTRGGSSPKKHAFDLSGAPMRLGSSGTRA